MRKICSSSVKFIYAFLSVLYLIVLPLFILFGSHLLPHSLVAKASTPIIVYLFVVGGLYLISAVYAFKSKRIGLILGVIASWIGVIPWIASILSGGSFFIKEDFRE